MKSVPCDRKYALEMVQELQLKMRQIQIHRAKHTKIGSHPHHHNQIRIAHDIYFLFVFTYNIHDVLTN